MSKVRDISNLSNIIKTDASGNVSFVSGSTTLATINTSGQLSGSSPVLSSSYAQTSSYASAFNVAGTLTATTLVVQTITSSVLYSSGSNVFGNASSNNQIFTGSLYVTGAFYVTTGSVGIGTITPGSYLSTQLVVSAPSFGGITIASTNSTNTNYLCFGRGTTTILPYMGSVSYNHTSDFMAFATSGSERMRIDSTGNVGIGTSSPTELLHLYKSGTVYQKIETVSGGAGTVYRRSNSPTPDWTIGHGAASANENFEVYTAGTGSFTWTMNGSERMRINSLGQILIGTTSAIWGNGTTRGVVEINGTTQSILGFDVAGSGVGYIYHEGTNMSINNGVAGYLALRTNSTTRMTITSGGDVGIGTGSPGCRLDLSGGSMALNDNKILIRFATDTNHSLEFNSTINGPFLYGYLGAALGYRGTATITTNLTNAYNYNNSTTWQQTSDIRIKQNIRPISNVLNKIVALNPTHFEFKTKPGVTQTGFIAQEFEQVFPGHVTEIEPTGEYKEYFAEGEMIKSLDADLIPYLVKAIQELKAENDTLKEILQRNNIQ